MLQIITSFLLFIQLKTRQHRITKNLCCKMDFAFLCFRLNTKEETLPANIWGRRTRIWWWNQHFSCTRLLSCSVVLWLHKERGKQNRPWHISRWCHKKPMLAEWMMTFSATRAVPKWHFHGQQGKQHSTYSSGSVILCNSKEHRNNLFKYVCIQRVKFYLSTSGVAKGSYSSLCSIAGTAPAMDAISWEPSTWNQT